jgi:hypothetical protein
MSENQITDAEIIERAAKIISDGGPREPTSENQMPDAEIIERAAKIVRDKLTPQQRAADEDEARRERERIFLREHAAQAYSWEYTGAGIPGPAGKGPTQSQDSPGADDGTGLKA